MQNFLPKSILNVIEEFSKLPGIGPKTAERLTFHLLRSYERKPKDLGSALIKLRDGICFCEECFNWTTISPCSLCTDVYRDNSIICVVEEPLDMTAIEKTHEYKGLYHILHGSLSPIDGIGPSSLRIGELIARVKKPNSLIRELILATNPSTEGEATAMYIYNELQDVSHLRITRIAKGIPSGGVLEYADNITLVHALKGRKDF